MKHLEEENILKVVKVYCKYKWIFNLEEVQTKFIKFQVD